MKLKCFRWKCTNKNYDEVTLNVYSIVKPKTIKCSLCNICFVLYLCDLSQMNDLFE